MREGLDLLSLDFDVVCFTVVMVLILEVDTI